MSATARPGPGGADAAVLVYGLGRSGLAAARLAARQGHAIEFFERRQDGADVEAALAVGARRLGDPLRGRARVCIAAPGVAWDHPDLTVLRERGVEVIGEVEWVWRTIDATYVGVTGTAGKGTTTRWIADTLASAGIDAVAGGNIDPALAEVARPGATLVTEMSSFQLERCPTFRPAVAVVLNLGEDHIDRHGSVAAYHAAKHNLVRNLGPGDVFVFNDDDAVARAWASDSRATTRGFSLEHTADAALDRERGLLLLDGEPLQGVDALQVIGDHQVANALAVALACRALGVGTLQLAAALASFTGLPGRYAHAGRVGDVSFIEDSIATRPLAVRAALAATPGPLVWIAGGQAKGADVSGLHALVGERVALLLGVGDAGPAFADAFAPDTHTRVVDERDGRRAMERAVREAHAYLLRHHGGSGCVLLAPLAASFDQFKDYTDRARAFRDAVEALARDQRRTEEARWTPSS